MAGPNDCFQVDQSRVRASASFIKYLLPAFYTPTVGIIGGSGLSTLENMITSIDSNNDKFTISFDKIPGFPIPSVQGHAGKLIFGTLVTERKSISAVVMSGRAHFYEGNDPKIATFPIRVLGAMGVDVLISESSDKSFLVQEFSLPNGFHVLRDPLEQMLLTNAAGGLNRAYRTGDIMIMNDHISFPSLTGTFNPLLGPLRDSNPSEPNALAQRFLALSDAYDYDLRKAAWKAWERMNFCSARTDAEKEGNIEEGKRGRRLQEGIYAFVAGPTYETRAEARLLTNLGADVVGMSTVPEVIVARHIGIRLLGISLVTNMVVQDVAPHGNDVIDDGIATHSSISDGKANHAEVMEAGKESSEVMRVHLFFIIFLE
ncbi:putative purine nucleoside phosphorylase [Golovinomyces cichoracearum]|uniref:purine-nucleoside phosphorylase n=1 Tax=Golovinomyces cichoracearum TaxID=62708 RepID=A0A420H7B2_9PEZI|nr:putative purine nucleoside phosphorylase [Golovinomyces cichoracearum]